MICRFILDLKYIRKFTLYTLVWLTIAPLLVSAQFQNLPEPERISDRQGLPQAFVPSILQDKQGFIWIATRDGLCRYDGNTFNVFQPSPDGRPTLSSPELMKMALDHQGKIWIFSQTGDLDLFDPAHETFVNVSRLPFYQKAIGKHPIQSLYVDSQNGLWICFQYNGLAYLDLAKKIIRPYRYQANKAGTLHNDTTRAILEDQTNKQILWVLTNRGLSRFNRRNGRFLLIQYPAKTAGALPEAPTKELYAMPNGNLLIRSNGYVSRVDQRTGQVVRSVAFPSPEVFWRWSPAVVDQRHGAFLAHHNRLFRLDDQSGLQEVARLPTNFDIQSLFIDRSEVLWVGTNGGGVFKYNLRAKAFTSFPYQQSFQADVLTRQLKLTGLPNFNKSPEWAYYFRSTIDSSGRIWCNVRDVPFMRFHLPTRHVTTLPFVTNTFSKDPGYPITMTTDPQGRVWALYDSLAAWYDEPRSRWVRFPHRFQYQPRDRPARGIPAETVILDFVVDEQALWLISQAEGLYRIDRQTGAIRHYTNEPGDPSSLSSNKLLCLFADPADKTILWIGTFGSGLCRFDKRSGKSRRLTTVDGLPNNVIYAAIPDRLGSLWVATNQGLGRMNRRTFKTRVYTHEDGLAGDEFNRYHRLQLPDGRIFLGGLEGITTFDPTNLREDRYQPPVQITGIQINGKPLTTDSEPVHILAGLTLPYNQNFVTVQFAGMQFNRRNKLKYRYQLEGLEDTWTETDRPVAIYTGLQPGHYTLRLNAANTEGIWSNHIRALSLTIEPPLWATWWAYVFYTLATGGIAIGLIRAYVYRLNLQQSVQIKQREVALKQQEAEQLRETNDMKTRFFANITHEFRTPLTLILAPTEQMVSENPEPRTRRRLATIEQNAHQLLRLINQLLDLSRLDASMMPIHEARGDLTDCMAHWLQPLIEQAISQGITLTFQSDVTGTYWFDAEKLEQIVYNLAANALKFIRTGSIDVGLHTVPEGISLTVADTGIGISPAQLPYIFDRFYQAKNTEDTWVAQQPGTGIGLALVKELVERQQGAISVDSQVGIGTTFVVILPYRKADRAELARHGGAQEVMMAGEQNDGQTSQAISVPPTVPAHILIVEDNDELAHFIAECLPAPYQTRRAVNGHDGLQQALEQLPDLIISDVLMPQMDGYTLCGHLKTDLRTSHIPVILLTAKVTRENRLEGLAQGADDYLTKPFYIDELRLRVHNLLEQRRRQREWIHRNLTSTEPADAQPLPEDPFLTRLNTLLEANLTNPHLSVENLADELAMSRSHLHRKVKALTGFSANELVRNYRLKAATELLRQGFNSSETADRVGFDSLPYFSKCFRELYGMSPTEFVRLQKAS